VTLDMQTYVKCLRAMDTMKRPDVISNDEENQQYLSPSEDKADLDSYVRDVLAPRDGPTTVQDVAFANALAESFNESSLTRKI